MTHHSFNAPVWTEDEDAIIREAIAEGVRYEALGKKLPGRTLQAMTNRVGILREDASIHAIQFERQQRKAATEGSASLLRALLRAGLRRRPRQGLEGLTDHQFRALCRRHDVRAR